MAYPIILIDSATGSNTAASGAGPSTALTGTAAATDSGGTTVTLDAGTDLTGVDTTGLHAIYLSDSTSGHRNFSRITGSSGSGGGAPTVTVATAFTGSLSGKSWAIGGKRASLTGGTSVLLYNNNSGNGDAMPGWVLEMQSGHAESYSTTIQWYRAGDTTSGPIILRGAAGAATKPVLTYTGSSQGANSAGVSMVQYSGFDLKNTGSGTYGFILGDYNIVSGVKVWGTSNWSSDGAYTANYNAISGCEICNCRYGIQVPGDLPGIRVLGNYIHDNSNHGLYLVGGNGIVYGNIFSANGGDGARVDFDSNGYRIYHFINNVFFNNASDGIESDGYGESATSSVLINNFFGSSGGYGVNFSSGSATAILLNARGAVWLNNAFLSNTSGTINVSGVDVGSVSPATLDNASYGTGGSFTPGSASTLKAAFPITIPGTT